jgi:hypothetical protein
MTPYVDPYDDTPSQTFYGEVLPRYGAYDDDSPPIRRRVRETDLVATDGNNTFHFHLRLEEGAGNAADRQRQFRLILLSYRAQMLGVVFGALSFLVATAALLGPFPQLMATVQRWSAGHPWLFGLFFFIAVAVVCYGGAWLTGHRLFLIAGEPPSAPSSSWVCFARCGRAASVGYRPSANGSTSRRRPTPG